MFLLLPVLLTLACCYDLSTGRRSYSPSKVYFDEDAEVFFPLYHSGNEVLDWVNPSHPFPLPKYVIQPKQDYSYVENGGATNWSSVFPECGGDKQSPIDINTFSIPRKYVKPLIFENYWDNDNIPLFNNTGKHAKVTLLGDYKLPTLVGGPLDGEYTFDQLHFHWGRHDSEGSEHTVDLEPFSMEAHVVHFKTKYGTIEEAAKHEDGLAVVAFFLQAAKHKHNKHISDLVDSLPRIRKALSTVNLQSSHSVFGWFKDHVWGDYATYSGSLTTPPCSQSVTWIVYTNPCFLSTSQVAQFRSLKHLDGSKIKINYRPVQRLLVPDIYGPLL